MFLNWVASTLNTAKLRRDLKQCENVFRAQGSIDRLVRCASHAHPLHSHCAVMDGTQCALRSPFTLCWVLVGMSNIWGELVIFGVCEKIHGRVEGFGGGGGRGLKLKVQHHGVRGMGSGSWMSFTITVFQNCTQILKFQCIVIIVGDIFHLFFQNGKHNTYVWALQLSHYAMLYHCIKRT